MSETQEIEINDNTEKRGRGRPKKNPEECKLSDKDYFKKYYKNTVAKITCPVCGCQANNRNMTTHQKSVKCKYVKLMNAMKN